ncbi:MAG TPA: type II toxin-antitoxin system RelE/ParE family toxin [Croceibacterium sp.]
MTRFALTPAARRDLAEIWFYTADQWGIDRADAYVRRIESDLSEAAMGSPLVRPIDDKWRIKSGRHVCFFRKPTEGKIEVIRILHERMDPSLHLDEAR